ncbi:hypothetical protein Pyn_11850 [Prunus yedoensis var. nudiflora]|uniref:Uncharacterized protein n=1 Tax=Prunus yedoensis var. nudiflora TaxID=2094558 RepID=A0A314YXW1_PRUYE|nr:hypothetical protein Pyn_11850 [Prunus yedoensis var. nudiflora]
MPEDVQDSNSNDMALVEYFFILPKGFVKFSEEHDPDTFRQLLQSICPSIYGHELVEEPAVMRHGVNLKIVHISTTWSLEIYIDNTSNEL